MRNFTFIFIFLLFSCSKEVIEDSIPPFTVDLVDWSKSSYQTFDINHPTLSIDIVDGYNYGSSYITVDYNNDGFLDLVGFALNFSDMRDREDTYYGYERKNPIKFYLGDSFGNFKEDQKNSNNFLGLVHGRKILLGDFNNDSLVDFFFVGHGYDRMPFLGEYTKVLYSDPSGIYSEVEFTDYVSFFHGGASGDIDNDGDLDIFLIDMGRGLSMIFENVNGELIPRPGQIDNSVFSFMFITEIVDVNSDGYLDILVGGHDNNYNSSTYDNPAKILFGSAQGFNSNNIQLLPTTGIEGQGTINGFEVLDINGDNKKEIMIVRTGDGKDNIDNFYKGWSIQVVKSANNSYIDATDEFITSSSGTSRWFTWTKIKDYDKDGNVELYNSAMLNTVNYHEWELVGGKFIKK